MWVVMCRVPLGVWEGVCVVLYVGEDMERGSSGGGGGIIQA